MAQPQKAPGVEEEQRIALQAVVSSQMVGSVTSSSLQTSEKN